MMLPASQDPAVVRPANASVAESSCAQRALCGWSPPDLEANTPLKRAVDRLLPRTGLAVVCYFGAIAGMLIAAPLFPKRGELMMDGLAALFAAAWCGLNFWRCRHAHCLVTTSGWSVLVPLTFAEAAAGRSLIGGDEQLVFLAVLVAGLAFEGTWSLLRGTNAVGRKRAVTDT